jgi:hypothetical protein
MCGASLLGKQLVATCERGSAGGEDCTCWRLAIIARIWGCIRSRFRCQCFSVLSPPRERAVVLPPGNRVGRNPRGTPGYAVVALYAIQRPRIAPTILPRSPHIERKPAPSKLGTQPPINEPIRSPIISTPLCGELSILVTPGRPIVPRACHSSRTWPLRSEAEAVFCAPGAVPCACSTHRGGHILEPVTELPPSQISTSGHFGAARGKHPGMVRLCSPQVETAEMWTRSVSRCRLRLLVRFRIEPSPVAWGPCLR